MLRPQMCPDAVLIQVQCSMLLSCAPESAYANQDDVSSQQSKHKLVKRFTASCSSHCTHRLSSKAAAAPTFAGADTDARVPCELCRNFPPTTSTKVMGPGRNWSPEALVWLHRSTLLGWVLSTCW